jgi:hypothetical protein
LKQLLEHAKDDPELNGLEPAGWYHSVYGDLAITRKDAAIQDRYFPDPWKPLALIRRVKGEPATVAFYLREKNVVLRFCSQYPSDDERQFVEETPPDADDKLVPVTTPRAHSQALLRLLAGIQDRKGLLLLSAESEAERTEALQSLGDMLNERGIEFACLRSPAATSQEFYAMLAWDLALQCSGESKTETLYALNDALVRQANRGSTTALIIDNAQDLPPAVIEEICLLENLQSRKGRLIQVVLAGDPAFVEKLNTPEFANIRKQIAVCCRVHSAVNS